MEPRYDIWPTDPAPIIRRREDGAELVQLRWGFPPARPKGAPVINFRSEGRRFPKGRCLIPASHFFEFTGKARPHHLLMGHVIEFGDISLVGAHVGGLVSLSGSKVTGKLEMDNLQVGSTVFMGRGAEFDGPINLLFGEVGGNLELAGGLLKGTVDLTGTGMGGELRLGSSRLGSARWSPNAALILRDVKANAIQDLSDSWPERRR